MIPHTVKYLNVCISNTNLTMSNTQTEINVLIESKRTRSAPKALPKVIKTLCHVHTSHKHFVDGIQFVRIVHFDLNTGFEVFEFILDMVGLRWRFRRFWNDQTTSRNSSNQRHRRKYKYRQALGLIYDAHRHFRPAPVRPLALEWPLRLASSCHRPWPCPSVRPVWRAAATRADADAARPAARPPS